MLSERNLRVAAAVLALVGIGVATYIAIAESGGGAPKCLVGGGGCETVANSKYSDLAGINVAVIGIAGYVVLLLAAAVPGDAGRFGGFLTALVGFGFSAYLTYLELFVIDAICQWCVASAVLMTLSLAVAATRAFLYSGRELTTPQIQSSHGR
ncbi:MAG TPA: vitamin K epoxide reductase family protein [Solirubrobacterales bacterium]|nr:vitamin K epoxide reductase family protein [Solirubrobacterales bacterium]